MNFLPKIKLELFVSDDFAAQAVDLIKTAAATGKIGDGKIVVQHVEQVVRIRTGETGEVAL